MERHYQSTRVNVGGAYQAFSLDGLEVGGTGGDGEGGCWLLQDAREQLQADRCSSNLLCKLLCSCLPCRLHRHTMVLGVGGTYQAFSLIGLGVGGMLRCPHGLPLATRHLHADPCSVSARHKLPDPCLQ